MAGLLAGLIAEPIKAEIQRKVTARRAENAILGGFKRIELIVQITVEMKMDKEVFWTNLSCPPHDHYWEKNRELFFEDAALERLHYAWITLMQYRAAALKEPENSEEAMTKLSLFIQSKMPKTPRSKVRRWWLRTKVRRQK